MPRFASCRAYDTEQNIYDPNLMCSTGADIYVITKQRTVHYGKEQKRQREENHNLEVKEDFSKEIAFKQKSKWW